MGKVIRISDSIFRRLQKLATPFEDSPANVIERLLDHYDGVNFKEKQNVVTDTAIPPKRKKVDTHTSASLQAGPSKLTAGRERRELGKQSRKLLVKHLEPEWGWMVLKDTIRLVAEDQSQQIICLYSGGSSDSAGKWFFGINKKYWSNWRDNDYLAFLMRDGNSCSYILLSSDEAKHLLSESGPDMNGEKKINIRTPASGKIYFQELPDFNIEGRIVTLT